MSRKTVIIIGAAGFVGRAVVARLAPDYRLVCIDPDSGPAHLADHRWVERSLVSSQDADEILQMVDLDNLHAVVHLAAYYDFDNKPDLRYDAVLQGMSALLLRLGNAAPSARFVFSSSMAAMKPTEPGVRLDEESPRNGGWAYPQHKVEAESVLASADVPNVRVELVLAGVYSDWCELVPLYKQIERVRNPNLETYFYPGDADRGLTYVHVDEVADAVHCSLVASNLSGHERFLIGEDEPVTYRTIHDTSSRVFHDKELPLLWIPRFIAWFGAFVLTFLARFGSKKRFIKPWMVKYAGEHFEFDTSRAQELLQWRATRYMGDEGADI